MVSNTKFRSLLFLKCGEITSYHLNLLLKDRGRLLGLIVASKKGKWNLQLPCCWNRLPSISWKSYCWRTVPMELRWKKIWFGSPTVHFGYEPAMIWVATDRLFSDLSLNSCGNTFSITISLCIVCLLKPGLNMHLYNNWRWISAPSRSVTCLGFQ